jgi:putative Holliday junction resolvase
VRPIIGVDLGERRIGLAIAEAPGPRARPLATVARGASPAEDVEAIRRTTGADEVDVVLGLPLEASGAAGTMAAAAREWAQAVATLAGWAVSLRDERLSSHRAEERLGPMKRGRSGGPPTAAQRRAYRERVDREAAAIILQDELDARAAAAAEVGVS